MTVFTATHRNVVRSDSLGRSSIDATTARAPRVVPALRTAAAGAASQMICERLEDRQLLADIAGGLVANYYADGNFQNLALARTDETVNFNWGTGSPAPGVPAEGFSVRWTGQISAGKSGSYKLSADSAGGIRVKVGEKTVVDDWSFHSRRTRTGTFNFTAGEFYDVTIEYRDKGSAAARLLWTAPGKSATVVPQENLYRLGTGWVSDGWLSQSIGATTRTAAGVGGSFRSTGETFTLTSGSGGTRSLSSGTAGQIAYKTLRGDGEIVTRLDRLGSGAKADIVFRTSLDANAAYANLSVSGTSAFVEYRSNVGGSIVKTKAVSIAGKSYLKLKRDGNSFAAYASATGADDSWTLVGTAGVFMDTFAQVGIAVGGNSTTRAATSTTATFSSVRVGSTPGLGGNLNKVYDSSPERPFVDLVKLAHTFQTHSGKAAPVNDKGWPTISDWQVNVAAGGFIPSGTYNISFFGPAGARMISMRAATSVTKVSYNAATGEHIYRAVQPANQPSLGFRFFGTNGQVRNFRVLQPGYSLTNTPAYTTKYLNFMKNLSPASLRFMDWTATNEWTGSEWSKRSTPDSAGWVHRGISWEAAIDLCNAVGANLYANIPGRANDDYVRNLAQLIRTRLRPDLNVYLEQGNEMWATPFANSPWNYQMALDEVKSAKRAGRQSVLNYDNKPVNLSQTNLYSGGNVDWALRRTARRGKEIGDIFRSVWQAAGQGNPINTRVRVVLAAQIANLYTYDVMLRFINSVYGKPSNYFYTMAGAPYFTMGIYNDKFVGGKWTTLNKNATKDQLLGTMAISSGAYAKTSKWDSFWKVAKPYGLRLSMYEGGHDTFGPFNIAAKSAATLDPRMKTLMKQYLNGFFAAGGTSFNYYTLGAESYNTQYGTWAITNHPDNLNAPKMQAFREIRAAVGLRNVSPTAGVFR